MLLLAASLFLTNPAPLEMPRAAAYLVREAGVRRLEDRFNKADLWVSQTVDGRWIDDEGRVFMLAHLDVLPPMGEAASETSTRTDYAATRVKINHKNLQAVRTALEPLSPVELAEKGEPPRQLPRGYKDVDYWQGTNTSAIVCAYLPEKEKIWRLATWELIEGDDFDDCLKLFEKEFLAKEALSAVNLNLESQPSKSQPSKSERELLRADARHSVSAYDRWHVTDAPAFTVLDDLPSRDLVTTLTNDFATLRRAYAETLPTPIDGSNVLAVARIYATREEYLDALAVAGLTNMDWSAAYWSPTRRELVAYGGGDALRKTIRHEALHQYLSYATAMIATSPWLNEGYAQYFEDAESLDWELPAGRPTAEELERWSMALPSLLVMDYDSFYAGTDEERRLKYRLAWSIAVFLEKGADKVRFQPFKTLKADYFAALLETKDMREATRVVFRNRERLDKFTAEWLKFWKER